ncbi:hypothetical protein [Thalassorhabdomicrobium marinisediminis]|uniref:hypothetical protein n=1 Tax=Thalassorhabdomicrobium marinisediminis TaxID=2170577 RepID=UPI0011B28CBE|nr:hypothetical protein [Thalassorhabdomicrobium marinisediminis]
MVGTSKILTVSYGTFSCTLEGFDDSFNTMKAIAEYFRGLAADDRYFGAEPPTPDAEMLAKIAEREISRRVDARMDDGGIVLRAAQISDQTDDAPTAKRAPEAAEDEDAEEVTADKVEDTAEDAAAKAAEAEAKAARKAKKAAEKAARKAAKAKAKAARKAAEKAEARARAEAEATAKIDAANAPEKTSDQTGTPHAEPQAPAEAQTSEAETTDDAPEAEAPEAFPVDENEELAAPSPSSEAETASEAQAEAPQGDTKAETAPAPQLDEAPAHPDADSVAAKLQRIRAVVGKSATIAPSDDLTEQVLPRSDTADADTPDAATDSTDLQQHDAAAPDSTPEEQKADTSEAASKDHEPSTDVQAEDQPVEAEAATDETESEDDSGTDMISRVMARHSADGDSADVAPAEDAAEPVDADAAKDTAPTEASHPKPPRARVVRMKRADFEKAKAAQPVEAAPDLGLLDGADELDEYLEDSDFDDSGLVIADDPGIDAELADDLRALADEDDEDAEAPVAGPDAGTDVGDDSTLTLTKDASADDAPEPATSDNEDDAPTANAFLTDEPQVDDAALERLMSETDAQLKEPEGSRRREAIAQLKAAVAAKEAARQVGETDDDDQDVENAFRNDLSEVVRPESAAPRPRPVVRGTTRTERPRPAPLKLVASQRVDLPKAEKREGPVTPRRVSASRSENVGASGGSFAEFAERMGAKDLPDLLEAAAAYTAFVEGAEEFSRPQILRRVRTVASDDFNREDGLRSFAKLLQDGRFTKVRNGRFQVADDSRFNPERRAG